MFGSVCFQRALNLDRLKTGTTAYKGFDFLFGARLVEIITGSTVGMVDFHTEPRTRVKMC